MDKLKATVDVWLGWLLAALLGLAVVNVVWQVFTRYLTRHPSSFTEESARYLLIWIGLLGAAYVTGRGMHLAIDLAPRALKGRGKRRLEVFVAACVFTFAACVMVWGGARLVWMTLYLNQTSAALQIKLGYVYLVLPISGFLMMFYALAQIVGCRPTASGSGPRK